MSYHLSEYETERPLSLSLARQFCEAYVKLEAQEKDSPSAKRPSFWDKTLQNLLKRYEGTHESLMQGSEMVGSRFSFPDGSHAMASFAYPGKLIVDR